MGQHVNDGRILALDFALAIAVLPERNGNNPVLVGLFLFDCCVDETLCGIGGVQLCNHNRIFRTL